MLKIQDFLRSGGTPEQLTEQYAIRVHRHNKYPNLLLFKYNQLDSPMAEEICREARGLILDEDSNWSVVCYTFKKFFNYGEGHAHVIEPGDEIRCYDKVDGTLIQMYFYAGEWHVATSGKCDASGGYSLDHPDKTFADLFWKTWSELNYQYPDKEEVCFAFELMTQYNRIICKYDKPRIVFLGARDRITLEEINPQLVIKVGGYNWECVKSHTLNTLEEIIEHARTLEPMSHEGYVLVSGWDKDERSFARIKVKSPSYVALAHLKEGMSAKRLLEIIKNNESEEFLSYFPEFRPEYEDVKKKYETILQELSLLYSENKDIPEQKEFANKVKNHPLSGILFCVRNKKVNSIAEGLRQYKTENLLEYMGYKKGEENES